MNLLPVVVDAFVSVVEVTFRLRGCALFPPVVPMRCGQIQQFLEEREARHVLGDLSWHSKGWSWGPSVWDYCGMTEAGLVE